MTAAPHRARPQPFLFVPVKGPCRYAKIDVRDYGRASAIAWHTSASGYPVGRNRRDLGGDGRMIYLHVLVMGRKKGYVVDHMDGDKHNCRRSNLRQVRPGVNAANRIDLKQARSGTRGVHASKGGLWHVSFAANHKTISLGFHKELADARKVVDPAMAMIYGSGTRLTDGTPFTEANFEAILNQAAALPTETIERLLIRTANLGDALSHKLRRDLLARFVIP